MAKRPRRKFGRSQKDRIFFACFPDSVTAARIHALAETVKHDKTSKGHSSFPSTCM